MFLLLTLTLTVARIRRISASPAEINIKSFLIIIFPVNSLAAVQISEPVFYAILYALL